MSCRAVSCREERALVIEGMRAAHSGWPGLSCLVAADTP